MKRTMIVLTIVAMAVLARQAPADWTGEPAKWVQLPDFRPPMPAPGQPQPVPPGIDVRATHPKYLADDFPCKEPGYITQVHVWGSWKNDILPQVDDPGGTGLIPDPGAVIFTLSFHKDIPPDAATKYSRPAEPAEWEYQILPGQFEVVRVSTDVPEGWYDPNPPEEYIPYNHNVAWLYNFDLQRLFEGGSLPELFYQQGTSDRPMTYWLNVSAQPLDLLQEAQWGWKSSLDHWQDDATWADAPAAGELKFWNELRYPFGHPMEGETIDLAFVIVPEPASMILLVLGGLGMVVRRRRRD